MYEIIFKSSTICRFHDNHVPTDRDIVNVFVFFFLSDFFIFSEGTELFLLGSFINILWSLFKMLTQTLRKCQVLLESRNYNNFDIILICVFVRIVVILCQLFLSIKIYFLLKETNERIKEKKIPLLNRINIQMSERWDDLKQIIRSLSNGMMRCHVINAMLCVRL